MILFLRTCPIKQVDRLLVSKMVESISMATTSLISLVQLLDKVKNMVISDHIQQEVSVRDIATITLWQLIPLVQYVTLYIVNQLLIFDVSACTCRWNHHFKVS